MTKSSTKSEKLFTPNCGMRKVVIKPPNCSCCWDLWCEYWIQGNVREKWMVFSSKTHFYNVCLIKWRFMKLSFFLWLFSFFFVGFFLIPSYLSLFAFRFPCYFFFFCCLCRHQNKCGANMSCHVANVCIAWRAFSDVCANILFLRAGSYKLSVIIWKIAVTLPNILANLFYLFLYFAL